MAESDAHTSEQLATSANGEEPEAESAFAESLLGYNLRRAYAAQLHRFHAYFDELGIRPVQFTLLGHLYHNPGTTQAQAGKALDIQRANLVTLLDQLEERGLLRRAPGPDDRRSRVLDLTPEGRTLTERLLEINADAENELDRIIGKDERLRLLGLLKALRHLRPCSA